MNVEQKIRKNRSLGANIRRIRTQNDLTQEQMVARLQLYGITITRSIFSQIECGTYNIRPEELCAIKQLFNVSYEVFFKEIEVPGEEFDYTVIIPAKK